MFGDAAELSYACIGGNTIFSPRDEEIDVDVPAEVEALVDPTLSDSTRRCRKIVGPNPDADRAREGGIERGGRSKGDVSAKCDVAEDE